MRAMHYVASNVLNKSENYIVSFIHCINMMYFIFIIILFKKKILLPPYWHEPVHYMQYLIWLFYISISVVGY